jgi:hypothetical protein
MICILYSSSAFEYICIAFGRVAEVGVARGRVLAPGFDPSAGLVLGRRCKGIIMEAVHGRGRGGRFRFRCTQEVVHTHASALRVDRGVGGNRQGEEVRVRVVCVRRSARGAAAPTAQDAFVQIFVPHANTITFMSTKNIKVRRNLHGHIQAVRRRPGEGQRGFGKSRACLGKVD